MMRNPRNTAPGALLTLLPLLLATLACVGGDAAATQDPLAAELDRSAAFLASRPADGPWAEVRKESEPIVERTREALRQGHRQLALQRLANLKANLAEAVYRNGISAEQRKDIAGLEAEWARMETVFHDELGAPSRTAFDGVPAAARAVGEGALPQVRGYYQASLDWGRNTAPEQGFYYLGSAQGQREVAAFARTMTAASPQSPPPLRSIRPELDALQNEMLAVYRPPLSIDRHGEFIVASATLKEARELDAAGLRYGALLRYLQAAQLFAPLRSAAVPPLADGELAKRLTEFEKRLSTGGVDHSLGQLFLETAEAEIAGAPSGASAEKSRAAAAAIAGDVLPRYFAAMEPAPPQAPRPAPRVKVTLVRWPYT